MNGLDEFALWMDLHDDYWDAQGRKSIDAVVIFGGLLSIAVIGSEAVEELGYMPRITQLLKRLDIRQSLPTADPEGASTAPGAPGGGAGADGASNGTAASAGA